MRPKTPALWCAVLAQGMAVLSAVGLSIFAPQPGQASALVPIGSAASNNAARMAARWVAREEAQWLAFDPQTGRATVIAPSAISLARAIEYGFLPLAAEVPACTSAPPESQPRERDFA